MGCILHHTPYLLQNHTQLFTELHTSITALHISITELRASVTESHATICIQSSCFHILVSKMRFD